MVDLNPALLQSKGLSATDVVNTLALQNLVLPSGTVKIDQFEYDVDLNASPTQVDELNDLPIKVVGNSTIYLRDVAHVRDGFAPQTNIVRQDGRRGVLVTVLKGGNASTLDVVSGIQDIAAASSADATAAVEDSTAGRPVDLRARRHQRRDSRSPDCGVSDRRHDPALPRKLAQHGDHRRFHSACRF